MAEMIVKESDVAKKTETIKKLKKRYFENVDKQQQVYLEFMEKLAPMISFIKDNRYYFRHPELDDMSSRGPILGKDTYSNTLYVYDLEDSWVKGINMLNTKLDSKRITLDMYFEKYDFDTAMKGLLSLVNYQDELIEELEKFNKKSEEAINKYMKIITEEPK